MIFVGTEAADAHGRALCHLGQQLDGVPAVRLFHLARVAFDELCPTRLRAFVQPVQ